MAGSMKKAEELAREHLGAFMPQQFRNPANPAIHRQTTAQEIWQATQGALDALVAGVGTGGTITGVGEALKQHRPGIRSVAVEPHGSRVLSGGEPGPHLIQGIGAGFVPEILNRGVIDQIVPISDEAAYDTAHRLAIMDGLLVGLSSGAACAAALQVAQQLGEGKTVVVIFPDTGERYASAEAYFAPAR